MVNDLKTGERVRFKNVLNMPIFRGESLEGQLGTVVPSQLPFGFCIRFDNGQIRQIWGECLERE